MHQHRRAGQELERIECEGVTYNLKIASWETGGVYEVWEMVWDKGAVVPCHEHHNSRETFFITQGKVEFTLAGRKATATAGDVIHVPPYMPHSMVFLEDTTWMAYFNNYRFYDAIKELNLIREQNPAIVEDEAFRREFGSRTDSHPVKTPGEAAEELLFTSG